MKNLQRLFVILSFLLLPIIFVNCDIQRPGVDSGSFSSVSFNHMGFTTNCQACHESQRPAPVAGVPHGNGADCVGCHTPTKWIYATGFNHTPMPTSCNSCHESRRPAPVAGVPHGNGMDCVACHTPTSWLTTVPYNHTPTPTSCVSCHESRRPAPVAGVPHGGGGDCVSCHVTTNWATVAGFNHTPMPTSCNSCHESRRPAPVGGYAHGNGLDCVQCHLPAANWTSRKAYSHSPVPVSCNACHSSQRPTSSTHPSINDPRVTDKTHFSSKDCYQCHVPAPTASVWVFNHGNALNQQIRFCLPCHMTKGWEKHGGSHPEYFSGDGNCFDCHNRRRSWSR